VAGIAVYVHATFLLLVVWMAVGQLVRGAGMREAGHATLLTMSVFSMVVLHELGHALMARRFGIHTRDITLYPIGGVARLERMPDEPVQELLVAIAGPAVNVAIALVLFGVVTVLRAPIGLEALSVAGGPFLTKLMWINVSLAMFNLLPAFPMDGGRVLRAALGMRLAPERATEVAARVGQAMALVLGLVGLASNPILVVIAIFVWFGASAEVSTAKLKSLLGGLTVRQTMITRFQTLKPTDPVRRAVALTLSGFQQDYPVIHGSEVVGVMTHADLLRALAEHGPDARVDDVMHREFERAVPTELADAAFARMQTSECRALVVLEKGRLVGLVTPENIGEILAFGTAVAAHVAAAVEWEEPRVRR